MNGTFRFVIGGCFLLLFSLVNPSFSQQTVTLSINGIDQIEKQELWRVHDSLELKSKLQKLTLKAYQKGYPSFSIDSLIHPDSTNTIVYGSIGPYVKSWVINLDDEDRRLIRSYGMNPKQFEAFRPSIGLPANVLAELLQKLERNGYPFARVRLADLQYEQSKLIADLDLQPNQRVKWIGLNLESSKIKLSSRFLENYLHIRAGDWYDQEQINLLPVRLKQLSYLREVKPAELLFTPEGATLYLYLESRPISSFNGTIGLQQNPVTLKYQFTGDVRLRLQNVLKRAEFFELNWRSIQPGSPQLKTQASLPYLFRTPFGLDGQFQLVKRDSTFLELKSGAGISYFLNAGNTLKAFYKNHQSNLLNAGNQSGFSNMVNNQYGLAIQHQQVDFLPNPRKGLVWMIEGSAGNRKITRDSIEKRSLVMNISGSFDWYIPIGKRWVFKTGLNTESYIADSTQTNELIRFGGNLNQRGFLEDEFYATTRTTGSLEIRFVLDQFSNLFLFYDQTWYERNAKSYLQDTPFGFGGGIRFGTNIGIFSLTFALGKQQSNPILLRDSKIHFGYIAYF
jgi:hypothetical protein